MGLTIVEARSEREREGIYALRYDVYVREMQRVQQHADHAGCRIVEPDDDHAILLAALDESQRVVGTARIHLKENIPDALVEFYSIDAFGAYHPSATSTTTKLMVAPSYRRSMLGVRLAQACYRIGLDAGIAFNFIDCNPGVRSFFDQLGYRQLFPDREHPEYGLVAPLVLALRDHAYLRQVGSPLRAEAEAMEHPSVAYLQRLVEMARAARLTPARVAPVVG